ncbi:MAG: 3-hydroxyacyl-CoA dehydrogenase NAD-binding domain-containing protein [Rhizomicrobium sp.]
MGLVDALVDEGKLKEGAIAFARKVVAEKKPLKKVRENDAKLEAAKGHPEIFANFRKANARKFRGFKAPEANIQCIEAAVNLPFDEGMKVERKLFAEVMMSPESAAQRYYFFAERLANKIPDVPDDTKLIPIKKVGIIGAGTMGGGIAMNFVNAGIPVTIVEVKQDALDRGLKVVRGNYERSAKNGRFPLSEVDKRMAMFTGSLDMAALADCDLVIEAVFERMDIKKDIFTKLDAIVKPGAILATNTSGLNIDEIASVTKRPEAVIGLHFFSPANVMKLLEIVRADKTAKEVIATSMKLAKTIGKIAVLVGVCPGFRRQPDSRRARTRGAENGAGRRDAVGRRPRALRFRLPDGAVRDERPRRPRHRLGQGKEPRRDHPRRLVRGGPPRPEDRRGLLRLRPGDPRRQALAGDREDHPRFRRQVGQEPAQHSGSGNPGALHLPDDQ